MSTLSNYQQYLKRMGRDYNEPDPVEEMIFNIRNQDGSMDNISNINCNELKQVKKFFTSLGSQFAGMLGLGSIVDGMDKSDIEDTIEKLTQDLENIRWLVTQRIVQFQDIDNDLRQHLLNQLLDNLSTDGRYLDSEFILYEVGLKNVGVCFSLLTILVIFIILNFIKFI